MALFHELYSKGNSHRLHFGHKHTYEWTRHMYSKPSTVPTMGTLESEISMPDEQRLNLYVRTMLCGICANKALANQEGTCSY